MTTIHKTIPAYLNKTKTNSNDAKNTQTTTEIILIIQNINKYQNSF